MLPANRSPGAWSCSGHEAGGVEDPNEITNPFKDLLVSFHSLCATRGGHFEGGRGIGRFELFMFPRLVSAHFQRKIQGNASTLVG